jgi:hypothetical protein
VRLTSLADQPQKASRLYRGLTVPVKGGESPVGRSSSELARGSLQLEAKATVKLGSYRTEHSTALLKGGITERIAQKTEHETGA